MNIKKTLLISSILLIVLFSNTCNREIRKENPKTLKKMKNYK